MNINPLEQLPKKHNKKFFVITSGVLVLVLIIGAAAGGYFIGYEKGKAKGGEMALKKIGDLVNPLNLLAQNPVFPGTQLGKVTKISDKQVTLKLANGDDVKATIDSKTIVTKGAEEAKVSDVKTNDQATVLTRKNGDTLTATRIILN